MTVENKLEVKKEIYMWAIEESRKDFEEIKSKFNRIEDWISQNSYPTFRQLEKLSNFLKVPLGYMFLDQPPNTNILESEFRTIGNKMPDISKELQDTLYNMSRKRDWVSEYRKDNGWDKIIPDDFHSLNKKDYKIICQEAKKFLDLDEFWYKEIKDDRLAYNYLREKLENKGIIVMQSGIVGSNNHRRLNLNEFRGFMLYDSFAPLIFINSNDSKTGKIFTLIHEYIHILFQEDDIFIHEYSIDDNKTEIQINKITAEFLMPLSHIKKLWNNRKDEMQQVEEFSKLFHVSKLAMAIRLKEIGIITQNIVDSIMEIMSMDLENKVPDSNGGDYYATHKSRYGKSFIKTVIQGAESGDISYTYAFNLLDGTAKTYDYYKEEIMYYGK